MATAAPAHPIEYAPRKADLPELYPEGRVCARPVCDTVLSIYNVGPLCWPCGGYDTVDLNPTGRALLDLMEEAP